VLVGGATRHGRPRHVRGDDAGVVNRLTKMG
jgi:hypothetical protein